MVFTTTRRLALAAFAATLAAGSGCGGSKDGAGAAPGDTLYAQALSHYDAATTAQGAGSAARRAGISSAALADFQASEGEFATARGLFDQLRLDPALCGPSPVSIHCDAAAYLAGRSSYEMGVDVQEAAAVGGPAGTGAIEFQDAVARLDAMEADYPASAQRDRAAYFDGRARFHLAELGSLATFAAAREQFQLSLAANPAGTYADNAQYYLGRCWYEDGLALVNVATRPTPGSPEYLAASADFQSSQTELEKVLSVYPGSPYTVNARYYLGKTFFERPYDNTVSNAQRLANLNTAIGWFDQVIAANGLFVAGAHYWRGRCRYALAFELAVAPSPPDAGQLGLALLDLKQVPPPNTLADNALYYVARCYVNLPAPAATDPTLAYCTADRAGDAPPASACAAYAALKALVATGGPYAGSPYPSRAQSYIQTALPSCACAW